MSRTHNEFVTIYCNVCGTAFHPKYGRELESRYCSNACRYKPYADKGHILQARILASIDKDGNCWVWKGQRNKLGYGFLRIETHHVRAHRASYMAFYGDIPEGMLICHKCDNPSCVNPDHLFVGTNSDNSRDMSMKGRAGNQGKPSILRGSRHPRSKLTIAQAREIKNSARPVKELSQEYGVSKTLVRGIRSGTHWPDA